jgi:hypothetical protein
MFRSHCSYPFNVLVGEIARAVFAENKLKLGKNWEAGCILKVGVATPLVTSWFPKPPALPSAGPVLFAAACSR